MSNNIRENYRVDQPWADAYGHWHVDVEAMNVWGERRLTDSEVAYMRKLGREAILREIIVREGSRTNTAADIRRAVRTRVDWEHARQSGKDAYFGYADTIHVRERGETILRHPRDYTQPALDRITGRRAN